LQFLQRSI